MAYPKPLSEKSLARLYQQAGISQEQSEYLHGLFQACANLYGAVQLRAIWHIYRMQEGAPKLKRKDLVAFSSIARREALPYYVFEVDEIYSAEMRADLSREIVSKRLMTYGYYKWVYYFILMDALEDVPYFVPKDIIRYAELEPSKEEKALWRF